MSFATALFGLATKVVKFQTKDTILKKVANVCFSTKDSKPWFVGKRWNVNYQFSILIISTKLSRASDFHDVANCVSRRDVVTPAQEGSRFLCPECLPSFLRACFHQARAYNVKALAMWLEFMAVPARLPMPCKGKKYKVKYKSPIACTSSQPYRQCNVAEVAFKTEAVCIKSVPSVILFK